MGGDIDTSKTKDSTNISSEVEKLNYEETINECKKLRRISQKVIVRNTSKMSQNEYDNVRIEYGKTIQ